MRYNGLHTFENMQFYLKLIAIIALASYAIARPEASPDTDEAGPDPFGPHP